MKIQHIHFGKEGGAERFFVNLARAFNDRGIEQSFLIRPGRVWDAEIAELGPVERNHFRLLTPQGQYLRWSFKRRVMREQPDAIMAWAPRASRLMPAVNGPAKLTRLGDFPKHLKYFQNSDVVIGNVPGIVDRLHRLGWTKRAEMISNFPKKVNTAPLPRSELDTPEDAFLVCSAGRFVHRKGMDLLIRAVAQLPGAYLWLAGEGEDREKLDALVAELDMSDRVRFTGWVAEPAPYLAAADAFVMPSRHEPLGNVLLEAWQLGIPSISTRSEGPSWFMQHERDGLMVDIDDLDALVVNLERLRDEPELRQTVVQGAKATLERTFSTDAVVDQYLALIKDIRNRH